MIPAPSPVASRSRQSLVTSHQAALRRTVAPASTSGAVAPGSTLRSPRRRTVAAHPAQSPVASHQASPSVASASTSGAVAPGSALRRTGLHLPTRFVPAPLIYSPYQGKRGGRGEECKMRDLYLQQLRLNQTQRVRLQAALQKLEELSPSTTSASVAVADAIPVNLEDGILKGHGTSEVDGQVVATLCGVVERVNKLVYVRTLRARYKPEIGDIIVGRVTEVATKLWRLEINFSQDALLMLSSMNLPDGIQRRRTATDELNIRSIFEENDVICAEVRGFQHDGSLHLQARSQKYGKLKRGQLLTVPPYLVKRRKQHFHHLENYGVDLIMGCNGFIWVGEHVEAAEGAPEEDPKTEETSKTNRSLTSVEAKGQPFTPLETRRHICRIANAVRVLSALGFSLSTDVIVDTAEMSSSMGIEIKDMLGAEFYVRTAEREVDRRMASRRKR